MEDILERNSRARLFCRAVIGIILLAGRIASASDVTPQRIISLAPALTEGLYLLGVQNKLVGCTIYCQRPPEAKNKVKVSTAIEVNLEKAVALKPDLVLSTSLVNPETKEKLKNLGIKVVDFPAAGSFSEICEQFLKLGKIVGKEKEAERIVNTTKTKVDSIKGRTAGLENVSIFIQVGARPLVTVTRDSFVNDFIEFAGGINIAKDAKAGLYSREEVLRKNPDVIIIVTMGIAGEGEKEIWQKYKTLNAVSDNRIYIIDAYKLCSPTPLSFAESLEKIAQIIHPQKLGE